MMSFVNPLGQPYLTTKYSFEDTHEPLLKAVAEGNIENLHHMIVNNKIPIKMRKLFDCLNSNLEIIDQSVQDSSPSKLDECLALIPNYYSRYEIRFIDFQTAYKLQCSNTCQKIFEYIQGIQDKKNILTKVLSEGNYEILAAIVQTPNFSLVDLNPNGRIPLMEYLYHCLAQTEWVVNKDIVKLLLPTPLPENLKFHFDDQGHTIYSLLDSCGVLDLIERPQSREFNLSKLNQTGKNYYLWRLLPYHAFDKLMAKKCVWGFEYKTLPVSHVDFKFLLSSRSLNDGFYLQISSSPLKGDSLTSKENEIKSKKLSQSQSQVKFIDVSGSTFFSLENLVELFTTFPNAEKIDLSGCKFRFPFYKTYQECLDYLKHQLPQCEFIINDLNDLTLKN